MPDNPNGQDQALRAARALLDLGFPLEDVLANPLIREEHRAFVRGRLERDQNFQLVPARVLIADHDRPDWLSEIDRSRWYYWPTLRQYLLTTKGWDLQSVRSLDDSSDRVLRQLRQPSDDRFDVRGLVLGFVQSGKTANFTALIAKAVDAGYRLVIVLSGIDNGLRRQTNIRLKKELVGYPDNRPGAVRLPAMGIRWHEFTRDELNGDFQPGFANHAALQGTHPVLLVVKKNGPVLRRLLAWLDDAPADVRQRLPMLMIDDEADQASVDTRGSRQTEEDPIDPDYEPPSVINGLIRDLLSRFERRAYVAYTATPFANILIPHDTVDPVVGNDLYPKDFIVDLPKPPGYFGAEEFFGRIDPDAGASVDGMDIIEEVDDADVAALTTGQLPVSLEQALVDFVLAGSARVARQGSEFAATMLIHVSAFVLVQAHLRRLVEEHFSQLRDEWRYQRNHGVRETLRARWARGFEQRGAGLTFDAIEPHVSAFFESVQVKEINSATGEVLDYEREPNLKAIAIGGNRLSRGLTLEGLLVSYFVRRSVTYDTLMQMGRWFGFREGYADLTRIYTTPELAGWFADLAFVEHRLREDIQVYEDQGLTPYEVGMRIWQHPTMQVTSPLKRRWASNTTISTSYSRALEQAFKFPLRRLGDLSQLADSNRESVVRLVEMLGAPSQTLSDPGGPVWVDVPHDQVLEFLTGYRVDDQVRSISLPLICEYIVRANGNGELTSWTVAVRGRGRRDNRLGVADWGLPTGPVNQISRSRLGQTDSLGVIVDPQDEALGLETNERGRAARALRPATNGLLLLYPISRSSGYDLDENGNRRKLFEDASDTRARDLVGLALSFPRSNQPQVVEAYLQGTVEWRPTG